MSGPADSAAGPGARLKRAREARELSVQEVADALNISTRVVGFLEAEEWSKLPRAAFTRGYLRAFAKLVGQDPEQIADAYAAAVGTDAGSSDVRRVEIERRGFTDVIHKQPGAVLSVSVVAAAAVAAVVLWAVWPDAGDRARQSETPAIRTPARQAQAPAATARTDARSTPDSAVQSTAAGSAVAPSDAEPEERQVEAIDEEAPIDSAPVEQTRFEGARAEATISDVDPEDEEPSVIEEEVAEGATRIRRITDEGEDRLTLTFSGECWVEVKNGEDEDLFSDLGRAGEVLELVGAAPFRVRLGYAPGVDLAFNSERVVLTPHTRNNVASIVLGQ